MASEDSDELVPGLLPIHRLHDLDDLQETRMGQMATASHELHAVRKLLEVVLLGRPKRMPSEERDDRLQEIRATAYDVAMHVLPMVVRPPVDIHVTYAEELPELVQTLDATAVLSHHEVMRDLVAGRVAPSVRSTRLPNEPDREASFSVYETDHPATELDQPFLLVFRTRHVVTMVERPAGRYEVVRDTPGFPAYSQMHTVPLPARGAAIAKKDGVIVLFSHVTLGRL